MNTNETILRSRLVIPINVEKFIKKAAQRNADAIILDLEDSIPYSEKQTARKLIKSSTREVIKGGSPVYVRVNNEEEHIFEDISHSVIDNVTGIVVPKVESKDDITKIDQWITNLENERNLSEGKFRISILIETAQGFLNMESIVKASRRIESISLGMEDLAYDMGFTIDESTSQALNYLRMKLILVAKANDILPLGLLGSIANYTDLKEFQSYSEKAYEIGYVGSSCIHPSQVEILNKAFSNNPDKVLMSEQIVKTFETALKEGRASAVYNGKMIDYPHYENAKKILEKEKTIHLFEQKKEVARKATKGDV